MGLRSEFWWEGGSRGNEEIEDKCEGRKGVKKRGITVPIYPNTETYLILNSSTYMSCILLYLASKSALQIDTYRSSLGEELWLSRCQCIGLYCVLQVSSYAIQQIWSEVRDQPHSQATCLLAMNLPVTVTYSWTSIPRWIK